MDSTLLSYSPTLLTTLAVCILTGIVIKILLFMKFVRKQWHTFKHCPLVGDFRYLTGTLHVYSGPNNETYKTMQRISKSLEKYHTDWAGPVFPTVVLRHPDLIKTLLRSSEPKPRGLGLGMSATYDMGIPWLGEGLLLSNGERWARNRRLLTPAFHFDILHPYSQIYNKAADILLDKIEAISKENSSVELFENISLASLDILLQCAFSYNSNCQIVGDKHPYVMAVKELTDLWLIRAITPWYFNDFIYRWTSDGRRFKKHCDYVHSIAEDIINARKEALKKKSDNEEKSQQKYLDFLDILLTAKDENGVGLTDREIRNEVDTFLFEGHDTTTSGICWILYSLAQHPDIQERVYQEIADVLSNKDSEYLNWEELQQLTYLSMCIKEGLRYHTPVPFIQRKTTQEMTLDGWTVPPGTVISAQIYYVHHNADVWEEPNEFRPERFLPENMKNKDPYAFIPFSAGPRNCIGQNFAMREMKTMISRIIYRYKIKLDPTHEVSPKISLVMKSETGIKIIAEPRK